MPIRTLSEYKSYFSNTGPLATFKPYNVIPKIKEIRCFFRLEALIHHRYNNPNPERITGQRSIHTFQFAHRFVFVPNIRPPS